MFPNCLDFTNPNCTAPFTSLWREATTVCLSQREIGLYLVTDGFAGDLLELADFSVGAPPTRNYVPYPAHDRGFVTMNSTISIFSVPQLEAQFNTEGK